MKRTFAELEWVDRLPSSPGVGSRILTLAQREDCSIEELACVVKADPASSGRLLRCANSARSRATAPFATIESAAAHLGAHALRDIALDLTLLSTHGTVRCSAFDYELHWSRALVRAIAAQHIGTGMGVARPRETYVLGLLAEIGCLVLASVHPEGYAAVLGQRAKSSRSEQSRAERAKFDVDHIEIAAYVMEEWGLPPMFGLALQLSESAERATHAGQREAAVYADVLLGAEAVTEFYHGDRGDSDATARTLAGLERLRKQLDLDVPAFHAFCDRIGDAWLEQGQPVELAPRSNRDIRRFGDVASTAQPSAASVIEAVTSFIDSRGLAPIRRPDGLSILAVDDDPLALKLLERTLAKAGHRVACAPDGSRALQIALETNPQVVIADWMMPNMDGIELCKALRSVDCGRDMFFILLTGRAEEDRVVEAFDAGIDDYVVKPFNPRLLMARIKGGHRVIELKRKVETDRQLILKQLAELGQLTRQLDTAAHTDVLTELPNRRYIMKQLEREWHMAVRTQHPLALIVIDIDHFKKVNDRFGHDVGDLVLKETARILRNTSRQGEELARLGGEEFLIVCSGASDEEAAAGAERMRRAVELHRISTPSFTGSVTISLGVAGFRPEMPTIDAFLKAADGAVYEAKHAGRNCVVTAGRTVESERRSA